MFNAVYRDFPDIVQVLVDAGADVNKPQKRGVSPDVIHLLPACATDCVSCASFRSGRRWCGLLTRATKSARESF